MSYSIKQVIKNPKDQYALFYYHSQGQEFDPGGIMNIEAPVLAVIQYENDEHDSLEPFVLGDGSYYLAREFAEYNSVLFCGYHDADTRGASIEAIARVHAARHIKRLNKEGSA